MSRPTLSIIVPTICRPTLERTLRSIRLQSEADRCEVLVVEDTHGRVDPELRARVQDGFGYRYLWYDGGLHAWGHPQRNYGATEARGAWLHWMADDDIYAPDALGHIFGAIDALEEPCPLLFRVDTWQAGVVWRKPRIEEGGIDAECIVAPNLPERLGTWQPRYNGDFDFIAETARRWDGRIEWRDRLIARCRPSPRNDWTS